MKKNLGYSLVEIIIVLIVASAFLVVSISFFRMLHERDKGEIAAIQAADYASYADRYLNIYAAHFTRLLLEQPGGMITVPVSVLKEEGLLSQDYPELNRLNQAPCLAIKLEGTAGNSQLLGIVYYRNTNKSKFLSRNALLAGLGYLGAFF